MSTRRSASANPSGTVVVIPEAPAKRYGLRSIDADPEDGGADPLAIPCLQWQLAVGVACTALVCLVVHMALQLLH